MKYVWAVTYKGHNLALYNGEKAIEELEGELREQLSIPEEARLTAHHAGGYVAMWFDEELTNGYHLPHILRIESRTILD